MTQDEFNAVFNLPFTAAEEFFKNKLNIPTAKWDDLWKDEHAKGFMSAGAMKAELLADLHTEISKAIAAGLTKKEFLAKFDDIVARHGWSYKGGRKWRSNLIYDTNVTTAYQAGHWNQLVSGGAKYLRYVHADGVRNPRPQHVAWNGTVLPIEHDFWKTHYPPNGWKCHCTAVWADAPEVTPAPKGHATVDPKTGAPVGIDKGWDYNVGQAHLEKGYEVLANKFEKLPTDIAKSWMSELVKQSPFERFIAGEIKGNFPVAVLDKTALETIKGESQAVWLSDDSLSKNKGEQPKRSKGYPELTLNDYRLLPEIIGSPELVIEKDGYKVLAAKRAGSIYMAVVKTTTGKDELYLVSYRKTNLRDVEAEKTGGNVIHNVLS